MILAKELRRRFAYSLDSNSDTFMPIFSAATILNPEFCALLPEDLFNAGREEIKVWINRIPSKTSIQAPIRQSIMFSRLPIQRLSSGQNERSSIRFVKFYYIIFFI